MMRTVRAAVAAAVLVGTLAIGAMGAQPAGAAEFTETTTTVAVGGWLANTRGPLGLTPTLSVQASVYVDGAIGLGEQVIFRAGGQTLCEASTSITGVAACSLLLTKPAALLNLLLLQKVEAVHPGYTWTTIFGDTVVHQGSSTVIPIVR
jgi:hypothetical protein